MPELRWTLLIVGAVFIVALAWWERRRPHQASRQSVRQPPREPTLTLPEIRPYDAAPTPATGPAPPERGSFGSPQVSKFAAGAEIPVIEVTRGAPGGSDAGAESATANESRAADESGDGADESDAGANESDAADESDAGAEEPPEPLPEESLALIEPIVDWPPDSMRRIVALRLIAPSSERFAGRAIRQALAAEGFVLGRFAIFHKPDEQNRAVLSAASLANPGTFNLETMDTQRFGGLSLFIVLPGSSPPPKAFEELLAAARNLNERLQGALQDERGGPLTPTRIAAIREGLVVELPS